MNKDTKKTGKITVQPARKAVSLKSSKLKKVRILTAEGFKRREAKVVPKKRVSTKK